MFSFYRINVIQLLIVTRFKPGCTLYDVYNGLYNYVYYAFIQMQGKDLGTFIYFRTNSI